MVGSLNRLKGWSGKVLKLAENGRKRDQKQLDQFQIRARWLIFPVDFCFLCFRHNKDKVIKSIGKFLQKPTDTL